MDVSRRGFIGGAAAFAAASRLLRADGGEDDIARWERETRLVTPQLYAQYMGDGDTRGLAALEKLEAAFDKVVREARDTVVTGDVPAIWSLYNMGYVVKTRESLFSIDLVHRRDAEFASMLDFALITHNHGDHWRQGFYNSLNRSGKTVVSNFLDNFGVKNWIRDGGYVRGVKTFRIGDVEIRTSLIDHNDYLIDYTTAFEIKTGGFLLYHTGDSGKGTEPKLGTVWGRPDLWLLFPGCGIDTAEAVSRVCAKRILGAGAQALVSPRRASDTSAPRRRAERRMRGRFPRLLGRQDNLTMLQCRRNSKRNSKGIIQEQTQ